MPAVSLHHQPRCGPPPRRPPHPPLPTPLGAGPSDTDAANGSFAVFSKRGSLVFAAQPRGWLVVYEAATAKVVDAIKVSACHPPPSPPAYLPPMPALSAPPPPPGCHRPVAPYTPAPSLPALPPPCIFRPSPAPGFSSWRQPSLTACLPPHLFPQIA